MPKKKSKDTQAAQSKRFVETARALGVDESGKSFDRVLDVVVPKPKAVRFRPSEKKRV
jgi:hypothetical protein